jgi:hydrogenase maturation protein HypF
MMPSIAALHIEVKGIVQGVGFRPFVYGLAVGLDLRGWVCNTSSGVIIEVEGAPDAVERFAADLVPKAPPVSAIESVESRPIPPAGAGRFEIRESRAEQGYVLISPDIAVCDDCRRELFDPSDRRHRYPFINCTNCGPRFTIIADIPYDRPMTTMAPFRMCPACQAEYDNPLNRRFHAQPNACPACGPRVWLAMTSTTAESALTVPPNSAENSEAVEEAAALVNSGAVLALKGLGGFHLACDATDGAAVRRLRERKRRPAKPFAVMMAGLDEIRKHCTVTPEEEALLLSRPCPIVLLPWVPGSTVARDVAPGQRYLGVMLPYTPLHHMLLADAGRPLVMTSGNLAEEPIAQENEEAWRRLHGFADAFLFHDRGIYARYDDSVWAVVPLPGGPKAGRTVSQPVRRARGYAPHPLKLPFKAGQILACGTELKNTFCLTREEYAFLSPHIGDMENTETLEHFERSIHLYERLFRLHPEALVHDLHPDYLATRYAFDRGRSEGLPLLAAQHHHSHIASCLADNAVSEPVIGVALDGTGYGLDGTIWGGEWMIADPAGFRRAGRLERFPLPGGDAGIRHPCRTALALLSHFFGEVPPLPFAKEMDEIERRTVLAQVERGLNTAMTSSCGRLFDAVASLAGGRQRISYEAQAAIEMEMVSRAVSEAYPFEVRPAGPVLSWGKVEGLPEIGSSWEVGLRDLIGAVVNDIRQGADLGRVGSRFHRTLASMVGELCGKIAGATALRKVALSGGSFQNRLLLGLAVEELERRGLEPLVHHQVPANDGGVSLGQAVIGHFMRK